MVIVVINSGRHHQQQLLSPIVDEFDDYVRGEGRSLLVDAMVEGIVE